MGSNELSSASQTLPANTPVSNQTLFRSANSPRTDSPRTAPALPYRDLASAIGECRVALPALINYQADLINMAAKTIISAALSSTSTSRKNAPEDKRLRQYGKSYSAMPLIASSRYMYRIRPMTYTCLNNPKMALLALLASVAKELLIAFHPLISGHMTSSFEQLKVARMISFKKICLSILFVFSALSAINAMADDTVKASDFVEEASAKGLAEIESSKLALSKSESPAVRKFAEAMIADHTKANRELAAIAQKKQLEISDEPELMNKAKAMVLKQRDGQSFDEAYANNQVMAHEQTIELFQKAANSKDAELKAFAQKTLPKLQHHLQMAQELQANTKKDHKDAHRKATSGVDH